MNNPCDTCETQEISTATLPNTELFAKLSKALAHPARVQLLNHLSAQGTCYFGKLTDLLPLAASTISQHLSILKDAGLITGQADENRVCYCVNQEMLNLYKKMVNEL